MFEQRNTVTVVCQQNAPTVVLITEPVQRCNQYEDKNTPTKWEFEQIAWTLRTDGSGNKIGFERPMKKD